MSVSPHLFPEDYKIKNENGFTLIEVVAAITLYTVLLGSVFSLYIFSVNAYKAGSNLLDLQQNVRVATDFITREIRYAHDLQLVNVHEIKYICPAGIKNTIKYKNGEIVQLISNTETKIAYDMEELIFDWDEERKILYFVIKGISEETTYAVRSAVCLQNLCKRW